MKRAWIAAVTASSLGVAGIASAEPVRILVSAGNKTGLAAERPLRFADNDAKRVRDVLVSLGGVRGENATLLAEPDRAAVYAALDRAKVEAGRHRPEDVTFVFYFSGHGDREALHFGADRVLLGDLARKLDEVPAGLRIAVTDACRATRDKGFTDDEPFAISTAIVPQASGHVWLHASSDGEAAQEADELQGAIFTNAWLSGLRGAADANGDARVTLDESFAFAHAQTLIRSSKSSGVIQKPEAVLDLHEAGPLVITQTTPGTATLALPKAKDTHYLVYAAGSKAVLSELWGSPDRHLVLRVPAGRYVVQKRFAGTGGIAQLAIAEGESRSLEERDFTQGTLDAVARKGETDTDAPPPLASQTRPNELGAGYDAGYNARTGFVQGPRVGYARSWGRLALALGGAVDLGARNVSGNHESIVGGHLRAGLEVRAPLGRWLTLRAGAGGRAGLLTQTIETPGASASATRHALALGPEIVLGARLALSPSWFMDMAATAGLAFLREESVVRAVAGAAGSIAAGARF